MTHTWTLKLHDFGTLAVQQSNVVNFRIGRRAYLDKVCRSVCACPYPPDNSIIVHRSRWRGFLIKCAIEQHLHRQRARLPIPENARPFLLSTSQFSVYIFGQEVRHVEP